MTRRGAAALLAFAVLATPDVTFAGAGGRDDAAGRPMPSGTGGVEELAVLRSLLHEGGERLAAGDPVAAETAFRDVLARLSETEGREASLLAAATHEALGRALYVAGRTGESLVAYRNAVVAARSGGDRSLQATTLLGVGTDLFTLGRYDEALEACLDALRLAEALSARELAARACHVAGMIHRNLGEPNEALAMLRRGSEAALAAGDTARLIRTLNEEGNVLHLLGDDGAAVATKQQALALARSSGDQAAEADCINDLALIADARGDLTTARRYLDQAYEITRRVGNPRERAIAALNSADGALKGGEPERARSLLVEALGIAIEAGLPVEEELIRAAQAELLVGEGRHRAAYESLLRAYDLRQSILRSEATRRVADMQALYDAQGREAQIELLRRDAEIQGLTLEREQVRRRALAVGFAAALLVAVAFGIAYRVRTRSAMALAAAHRRVEELSRTDVLTGLANRRHAIERLDDEAHRTARGQTVFALVLADLDDFKRINDTLGHPCGDRVLMAFGKVLASSVRSVDLAARWGGEEFLLVLPGTDLGGALTVADKVRERLDQPWLEWQGRPVRVTATFGVAECGDGDAEACLRAADEALYRGKSAGKNRVVAAQAP